MIPALNCFSVLIRTSRPKSNLMKRKLLPPAFSWCHIKGAWYVISYLKFGEICKAQTPTIDNSFIFYNTKSNIYEVRNFFWSLEDCSSDHIFIREFSGNCPKISFQYSFWATSWLLHKLKILWSKNVSWYTQMCSSH